MINITGPFEILGDQKIWAFPDLDGLIISQVSYFCSTGEREASWTSKDWEFLSILSACYSARLMYNKYEKVDLGYQSMCLPTPPPSEGRWSHCVAHNPAWAH